MTNDDILVHVEGVSKKFCRSLKRSLWYGAKDMLAEANPFARNGSAEKRHTTLRSDEFWAVNGVSFQIKRGECIGLIGHNGAGKTTLLKMLNGLFKPDRGRIEMRGRVGALIALGAGFNPILTGRENIYVNGSVLGMTRKEIDAKLDTIIDFSEIREFIDAPVQSYSSGMAVRLGFAVAVHCHPDILLLDEVLAVGDMAFQAKCFNKLAEFREKGVAFILVSHNMHHISRYADRVVYMKRGQVVHLGDTETGIDHFTRDMDATGSGAKGEQTDWTRVYGSGKVILKRATFTDEDGDSINILKPGNTFKLVLDYECPGADVDDAMLDVLIRDREGVLLQATSRSYGVDFGRLEKTGQISVTFQGMPANGTEIQFFIVVLSQKNAEVYDWKRHIRLKVDHDPRNTGRIALGLQWELQQLK